MRVLQIGSDRSTRGILYPDSVAVLRQRAYGEHFDALDIIGFSLRSDKRAPFEISLHTHVYPTNSFSRILYGIDTIRIVWRLPKPDVISAQDPFEVGLLALLIARIRRVPLHVQIHTDFLSSEYVRHSLVNRLRMLIAGFVLKRAVRIRVVSERVKKEIVARCGIVAPIAVLPIFVDIDAFRLPRSDHAMRERFTAFATKILVVSRLEQEKNVALAIESFAQSAPTDACLIIVGSGSERENLERIAREKSLSDRIFFEGEKDAIEYYPLADLVLVTSLYEGYGLVIVEALAAGKPVLSTDVGIASEAGALVASEKDFSPALAQWFKNGPRTMHLRDYPYTSFDEYVRAYCADMVACTKAL